MVWVAISTTSTHSGPKSISSKPAVISDDSVGMSETGCRPVEGLPLRDPPLTKEEGFDGAELDEGEVTVRDPPSRKGLWEVEA